MTDTSQLNILNPSQKNRRLRHGSSLASRKMAMPARMEPQPIPGEPERYKVVARQPWQKPTPPSQTLVPQHMLHSVAGQLTQSS